MFTRLFFLSVFSFLFFHQEVVFAQQTKQEITIGVIAPLSGEASMWGVSFKNGVELALKDLDSNTRNKIKIVYEDDGMKPVQTVSALYKLISKDNIDVIFGMGSACGSALAPLVEQQKIPFLSVSSDARLSRGRHYSMNFWATPEEETRAFLAELKKRGIKKVARVAAEHDWSLETKKVFDELNKNDVQVEFDEVFLLDNKDFKTYIARLRARKDLDGVITLLFPGQLAAFAKQLRQQNVKLPIFGYEHFEDEEEVKASNNAMLNAWYVNSKNPPSSFLDKYKASYPTAPIVASAAGYDAVMLVVTAMQTNPSREAINSFLHTVRNYNGVQGVFSSSGDNRFTLPAAIKKVTEQGFIEIE